MGAAPDASAYHFQCGLRAPDATGDFSACAGMVPVLAFAVHEYGVVGAAVPHPFGVMWAAVDVAPSGAKQGALTAERE